jgi:hypothetical protein
MDVVGLAVVVGLVVALVLVVVIVLGLAVGATIDPPERARYDGGCGNGSSARARTPPPVARRSGGKSIRAPPRSIRRQPT